MTRHVETLVALVPLAFVAVACGAIVGIEDPIPAQAKPTIAEVDHARGVFVSAIRGDDGGSCGEAATPCRTIAGGLARLEGRLAEGKTTLYVGSGEYPESVALHAGVTIEGGWDVDVVGGALAWSKSIAGRRATVIRPLDAAVAVVAEAPGGASALRTLTVRTKPRERALPGQSVYGIFAHGGEQATTFLRLDDVDVDVDGAGDGAVGAAGDTGVPAMDSCPLNAVSTGEVGVGGAAAPPPSSRGTFEEDGYHAPVGKVGGIGGRGENGAAGPPPNPFYCFCSAGNGNCVNHDPPTASQGTRGSPGCGGGGGSGGAPGEGGGAAIAIYVWHASVSTFGGALRAGPGGRGGDGGGGGSGGDGNSGVTGAQGPPCMSGYCDELCTGPTCDDNCLPSLPGPGGSPGSVGGGGGTGGRGGGGVGGPSCAVFGASIALSGTTLAHAEPALGAGGAASGLAADRCE